MKTLEMLLLAAFLIGLVVAASRQMQIRLLMASEEIVQCHQQGETTVSKFQSLTESGSSAYSVEDCSETGARDCEFR